MKYQLNRDGLGLGEFSIDEIRRGRASGQFEGREMIWGAGMPQWQPLDQFLREQFPPLTTPPPIPITPEQKQRRLLFWVIGIIVVLVLVGAVFVGLGIVKVVQRAQSTFANLTTAGRPDALEAASKPVVAKPNTPTEKERSARRREFYHRQFVQGYRDAGDHSQPCDAEILRAVEVWIDESFRSGQATNLVTAQQLSAELMTRGNCEEAMMLTVAGSTAEELSEAIARFERATQQYERSRYRAFPRFYNLLLYGRKIESRLDKLQAADEAAVKLFGECFTDGSFRPEDAVEIAEMLVLDWNGFFDRNTDALLAVLPPADRDAATKWLTLVLAGEMHITKGWRARGGGFADKVTAKGWAGFQKHLDEARTAFTEAWELRNDLPLAPARMIYVSLGDRDITEMRLWFDRAVAAQIDYPSAWSDLRWGLRSRWYGDEESILAFGLTALKTRRFDTDVPRMFMDSINNLKLEQDLAPNTYLFGRDDIWTNVQAMYEGYLAEPTEVERRAGWRSSYAVVAGLGGKYAVAREQLEALDWKPHPQNLEQWGTDLTLFPIEIAGYTSALSNEVMAAEYQRADFEIELALTAYRTLKDDSRADERTRELIRHRIASLELEERLHRCEWIRFLPVRDDDPAWATRTGSYHVNPDGSVDVASGKLGHMIVCRARGGAQFEVKGEFDLVRSSTGDFQAGLVWGMPEPGEPNWLALRMKKNASEGQVVSYSRGWTTTQSRKDSVVKETGNTFEFRFQDGPLSATMNGKQTHREVKQPGPVRYSYNEFLVGLGAYNTMNETTIRYRDVQLRLVPATNSPAQN